MGYIVTTQRRSRVAMHCGAMRILSRRAVATLDDAKAEAWTAIEAESSYDARGGLNREYVDAFCALDRLPESGGTIGPLPDGTVIEVERA